MPAVPGDPGGRGGLLHRHLAPGCLSHVQRARRHAILHQQDGAQLATGQGRRRGEGEGRMESWWGEGDGGRGKMGGSLSLCTITVFMYYHYSSKMALNLLQVKVRGQSLTVGVKQGNIMVTTFK